MKIRNGFVSNSSTSSFVCEICGAIEADRDLCISDAEMIQCKNGHCFHEACLDEEAKKILEDMPEELKDDPNEVDPSFCPVCHLRVLTTDDAANYLEVVIGLSDKLVLNEIVTRFGTHEAFCDAVVKFRERIKSEKPVEPASPSTPIF